VILLDLSLPEVDGYEVARRIRQQRWGREMLLVAVTGWGQEADRHRTRQAGFDRHLVKPVDASALCQLLVALRRQKDSAA
jgi:CheY-like chemotaxis protein